MHSAHQTMATAILTLSILGKKNLQNNRQHFGIFFLDLPENRFWHFMQTVSLGDILHEMPKHVFWNKYETYHQFVVWGRLRMCVLSNISVCFFCCSFFYTLFTVDRPWVPFFPKTFGRTGLSKQCRPSSDATERRTFTVCFSFSGL